MVAHAWHLSVQLPRFCGILQGKVLTSKNPPHSRHCCFLSVAPYSVSLFPPHSRSTISDDCSSIRNLVTSGWHSALHFACIEVCFKQSLVVGFQQTTCYCRFSTRVVHWGQSSCILRRTVDGDEMKSDICDKYCAKVFFVSLCFAFFNVSPWFQ